MFHRTGQADSHTGKILRAPAGLIEQRQSFLHHPVQHRFRSVGHVLRQPLLRQDPSAEISHGNNYVSGPDVDSQDGACGRVEGKARRRPAAA